MAERGNVDGPSIVKEPHARLFFGVPNALFGSFYFPLLAAAVWIDPWQSARWLIVLPAAAAGVTSLFLAYSLLFVTRQRCPYWTAHIVNWILLFLVLLGSSEK
jgi:uncharacterized membrane protein